MRGSPRRLTWTHGPLCTIRAFFSRLVPLRRLAADQTPIPERGSAGSDGLNPLRVRSVFGTWLADVWTLEPFVPLTPGTEGVGTRWRVWDRSWYVTGSRPSPLVAIRISCRTSSASWKKFGPPAGSSSGMKFERIVTFEVSTGSTNA